MCVKPFAKDVKSLETLTQKEISGAKFMAKLKAAAKKANSEATAIPFFCNLSNKFADVPAGFLFMFGKIKPFKKIGADFAKVDGARGAMYVTTNDKGTLVLNLMIAAGKVRNEAKLIKGLKELVGATKATIIVSEKVLDEKALDAMEASAEAAEEVAEVAEAEGEEVASAAADAPQTTEAAPAADAKVANLENKTKELESLVEELKSAPDKAAFDVINGKITNLFKELTGKA
jgi:hypothetical protein